MNCTAAALECAMSLCAPEEPEPVPVPLPLYVSMPVIVVLVLASGLFSGLTLGLMGLDVIGLKIVMKGDNKELAKCAERIAPIRAKGNMLLCTLLLGNVSVNSALAILSADIFDGTLGFIMSTAVIVIFGEILPQAFCSRYGLQVGARTVYITRFLICLFYILTKPMSMVLDCLLGHEVGTVHSRTELIEMLKLQISMGACNAEEGELAKQVAEGALSFRDKLVHEVMTPLEDAYMLNSETRLGFDTIREIFETGFSRIPVYGRDKHDYRGLLYTKDLMLADPEDEMLIGDFINIFSRKVETFFKDTKLVEVLTVFKKGGTHMGIVRSVNTEDSTEPRFEVVGVLTLEDVVEEILQDEIVDETDVYVDVDNRVRVGDGRHARKLNLGVFNPVWRRRGDYLGAEEISAIGAHLSRLAFGEGAPSEDLSLSNRAIEWLVITSDVRSLERTTPLGNTDPDASDWLYRAGEESDKCTLVLQGKLAARVGREAFRSESGAFSLLGLHALRAEPFRPDFGAFLATKTVRVLYIRKEQFAHARILDKDPDQLERSIHSFAAGNSAQVSRTAAKELAKDDPELAFQRVHSLSESARSWQWQDGKIPATTNASL
mmetsp:Transcript_34702/g.91958  ORF Transcript_34702/g.91958 Transcript_34702/m.91958 type:complete len:605 (-) Transcript_34702:493-2307(-)